MDLNVSSEEQLCQLAGRGLAHGFGLHAHLVFVRWELVCTVLLVPQVEKPTGRTANHHQLTVKVLPVQVHVLQPPASDVTVKPTCREVEEFRRAHRAIRRCKYKGNSGFDRRTPSIWWSERERDVSELLYLKVSLLTGTEVSWITSSGSWRTGVFNVFLGQGPPN